MDYHGNIPGAGATDVFGAVMYAVTMGIIWFITVSVSPWQAGRNMMAKSEHVTFRAGAIAAACTVIFLMYLNLQSVTVLNLNPGMEDPAESSDLGSISCNAEACRNIDACRHYGSRIIFCIHIPVGHWIFYYIGYCFCGI